MRTRRTSPNKFQFAAYVDVFKSSVILRLEVLSNVSNNSQQGIRMEDCGASGEGQGLSIIWEPSSSQLHAFMRGRQRYLLAFRIMALLGVLSPPIHCFCGLVVAESNPSALVARHYFSAGVDLKVSSCKLCVCFQILWLVLCFLSNRVLLFPCKQAHVV